MILPAILLLLAASGVEIADDVVDVPAAEWRYIELNLKQLPVTIVCRFDAPSSGDLRMALLRKHDLTRMQQDRPYGVLAVTKPGARGGLRFAVPAPGDYVVLLDNRENERHAAKVRLHVSLEFGGARPAGVRYLSPARRLWVIVLSFTFFFAVLAYAGRKLLHGPRK